MGDPKRQRPKAKAPRKIWDPDRIKLEAGLKREYGLRKTRELWSASSELKKMRRHARQLLSLGEEGEIRGQKLVSKLERLGIAKSQMKKLSGSRLIYPLLFESLTSADALRSLIRR